ncbi:hypothetical protein HRbin19_00441 [bacterium HR19]|nr:hypothetical protein HRbin19_00441 [bacterium HR19]
MNWVRISSVIATLFFVPVISSMFFLKFSRERAKVIFPLASGIILSIVFLRILPESIELSSSEKVSIFMFAGVVISVLLDKINLLKGEHISNETLACWECDNPFSLQIFLGLGIHYLIDGFFLGGFLLSTDKFLIFLIPIFFHKLVDGFILSVIYSGQSIKRATMFITLMSLFNVIGVLFAYKLLGFSKAVSIFSPLSAGILIYVAIHDFIPYLKTINDFLVFILGAVISLMLGNLLIH